MMRKRNNIGGSNGDDKEEEQKKDRSRKRPGESGDRFNDRRNTNSTGPRKKSP